MKAEISPRVLMIAFHYPPIGVSSGVHRTLAFSKYLPKYGWEPMVLTVKPSAYAQMREDQLDEIPDNILVKRARAFDTTRHFSLKGRYWKWMALPDPWVSWFFWGIPSALWLIRKYRPKVLWSTYPIATAHCIGFVLHWLTGIPWIADFRDPMTEIDPVDNQRYPKDPALWKARCAVERLAVGFCNHAVFTTHGARTIYAERYSNIPPKRWMVIPNGYDERCFTDVEINENKKCLNGDLVVLLHSGLLYATPDRDPSFFFAALSGLRKQGKILPSTLRIILRASGFQQHYEELIRKYNIQDLVFLEPAIPYRDALAEMLTVSGLLLFQGHPSNPAIPAKFYEYLRARRPILAMVHSDGDTAKALKKLGIGTIVPLDSVELIATGLLEFLKLVKNGKAATLELKEISLYSREARTKDLAKLFDSVAK